MAQPSEAAAGTDPHGYYAPMVGGLVDVTSGARASTLATLVHDQLVALIRSPPYPCVGSKAAVSRGSYRFAKLPDLASKVAQASVANVLDCYLSEAAQLDPVYSTLICCFDGPPSTDEFAFERLLWELLQQLHDADASKGFGWDATASSDPSNPHFGFSFRETAFFLVGLHAGASRWARRFAWPTLIFNRHSQFQALRDAGQFEHLKIVIRERDAQLQGSHNPVLGGTKEFSEAKQYSGRNVEPDWVCPFTAKSTKITGVTQ